MSDVKPDFVKLSIPNETFWAIWTGPNTATVDNLLLADGIVYGDTVTFDPKSMRVLQVIGRKYPFRRYVILENAEGSTVQEAHSEFIAAIKAKGWRSEGFGPLKYLLVAETVASDKDMVVGQHFRLQRSCTWGTTGFYPKEQDCGDSH